MLLTIYFWTNLGYGIREFNVTKSTSVEKFKMDFPACNIVRVYE